MDKVELIDRISEIIFAVPHDIYKYSKPGSYSYSDWKDCDPIEKAYLLVEELLINLNKEKIEKHRNESTDVKVMCLGKGPTFYNGADENMFFNAIYSMPSYVQIKGSGTELHLYYSYPMTIEEKDFLKGLLKRYNIGIPNEIEE